MSTPNDEQWSRQVERMLFWWNIARYFLFVLAVGVVWWMIWCIWAVVHAPLHLAVKFSLVMMCIAHILVPLSKAYNFWHRRPIQ